MKFLIVKSAAFVLAFLGQAAATDNTINDNHFAQFGEDVAAIRDSGAEVLVRVHCLHVQ
jgi:hypothetical protein